MSVHRPGQPGTMIPAGISTGCSPTRGMPSLRGLPARPQGAGGGRDIHRRAQHLSYFTAGVSKLISPVWRDGSAIPQIFRTGTYGDRASYEFVRERPPGVCKALAWSANIGETDFLPALVAPKLIARGTHHCPRHPAAERTQFLLATSRGYDRDDAPRPVLTPAFHDLR